VVPLIKDHQMPNSTLSITHSISRIPAYLRSQHNQLTASQQPLTMAPLKTTTLFLLYSLGALALAHPDSDSTKPKALSPLNQIPAAKTLNRRASDECTGDCATCFGSGFELCASSSTVCYLPGDSVYGEDSCTGASSSDVPTEPDVCNDGGCAVCFGSVRLDRAR
jgi:hypothetical protein